MIASTMPKAEEQEAFYHNVLKQTGGKPVTFRTLDIGGDKMLPYLRSAQEENPALGWRGRRHDTWSKRLSSRIANGIRSAVLGDAVRDSACTLRAMRRPCLAAIAPYHGMHRFVPTLLGQAGFRVIELEVRHRPRRHGVSKYGIRNRSLPALLDLLAVRWMRARRVVYTVVEDTGKGCQDG